MEQLLFNLAFNDKLQIMDNDFMLSFISAVKLEMVQLMKMDMHMDMFWQLKISVKPPDWLQSPSISWPEIVSYIVSMTLKF